MTAEQIDYCFKSDNRFQ